MEKIILVGYGGHAKSVADSIERQGDFQIVGYTDIEQKDSPYDYLGKDDVLLEHFNNGIHNVAISVGFLGEGDVRERLYMMLHEIGFSFPVIIDPSAIISESVTICEGSFVGKNVVINADAFIGKMNIINTNAIIEHDCVVGDFSHVAIGAVLCGKVNVGDQCLVGANATIIQNLSIGNNAIVGAGITITRNVQEGIIVKNKLEDEDNFSVGGGIESQKLIRYFLALLCRISIGILYAAEGMVA